MNKSRRSLVYHQFRRNCISSATCCGIFSEIFGVAECEIMCYRTLWNIAPSSQCEMKFAHIRVSEYFTFAKQIFHSEAISLARRANFVEKSTHLSVDKCVLFSGGGWWIRTTEVSDNRFTVCPLWPLGKSPIWSWWSESNQQPADYKSAALPLSHTSGTRILYHNGPVLSSVFLKFFKKTFCYFKSFEKV